MIFFNLHHTSYRQMLHDFSVQLQLPYKDGDDFLMNKPPVGEGMLKAISLFDELEVLLADVKFFDSITIMRPRSSNRYFILHFDDVYIHTTAKVKIDDETLQKTNTRHSQARLTSSLFENMEELPGGMHIKSVKVLFNEQWLKKYMRLDAEDDVLKTYLSLKTENFDIEPLDAEYLKLMDELWLAEKNDPLNQIFFQNRVTLLVERFFTRLFEKKNLLKGRFNLSTDVINRLIIVEKTLVEDFTKMPPTIEQFAKMVLMSSTMLKKNFKSMYGDSIYAYYQKQRLQKASQLLLSGQYSIKQTAEAVGYNSVSNFTSAYKKIYKKDPAV